MRINFVGDIGVFRKYEDLKIDPFDSVWLPESDLNVGNFEFIIPRERKKFFYDVQESYSCSFNYLKNLNTARFRGLGLANNHSMDYGLEGAKDTIDQLRNSGSRVFGFSDNLNFSICSLEAAGIKAGIIACVKKGRWSKENFGHGPDTYDVEQIVGLIRNNRNNFDHIFVFPHWGTELIDIPDRGDTKNARIFIDEGATAVIGHHPHVPQGIERYGKGIIAYSLGSFIYVHEDELGYSGDNPNRHISICLNIEVDKNEIKEFRPFYYKYNPESKIPEPFQSYELDRHISFMNGNIHNYKKYKEQLRKILLKRELLSFVKRFKSDPLNATFSFTKQAVKGIKKLF